MLTVTRARAPEDVRRFIALDRTMYAEEPLYAPPVRHDLHQRIRRWIRADVEPEHQAALFLVRDGDRVLGRISAAIDHARNAASAATVGSFGFLEAVDDRAVFGALFGAAEEWLVEHGMTRARGPFSFTVDDPYAGLLVEGFEEPPAFGATYSRRYYPTQLQSQGYAPALDLRTWSLHPEPALPPATTAALDALRARADVVVRPLRTDDLAAEALLVRRILDGARSGWAPVPLGDDPLRDLVPLLRLAADPRLVLFVEVEGEAAGCVLALPDWNDVLRACGGRLFPLGLLWLVLGRRSRRRLRVLAPGVLPRRRRAGLGGLLLDELRRAALASGYQDLELAGVPGQDGPLRALAARFGEPTARLHRVYEKDLR
jgi:hypothetical protein